MTAAPSVSVVVVHFDAPGLVGGVAETYLQHGHEVVVVDNSDSYDGVGVVVAGHGNVGFGAACNLGVASASNDVVVLHNADVGPDPAALLQLGAAVSGRRGIVAPAIDTGRGVRRSGFARPSPLRELYVGRRHLRAARSPRTTPERPRPSPRPPDRSPVSAIGRFGSAAVLAMPRPTFHQLGGFDERFFLYVEDLELWVRAEATGVGPGFAPEIVFRHAEKGGSSAVNLEWREILRMVGVELYAAIHTNQWRRYRWAHRAAIAGHEVTTSLGADVLGQWRSGADPFAVAAHVRASVLQGRLHDET